MNKIKYKGQVYKRVDDGSDADRIRQEVKKALPVIDKSIENLTKALNELKASKARGQKILTDDKEVSWYDADEFIKDLNQELNSLRKLHVESYLFH